MSKKVSIKSKKPKSKPSLNTASNVNQLKKDYGNLLPNIYTIDSETKNISCGKDISICDKDKYCNKKDMENNNLNNVRAASA